MMWKSRVGHVKCISAGRNSTTTRGQESDSSLIVGSTVMTDVPPGDPASGKV